MQYDLYLEKVTNTADFPHAANNAKCRFQVGAQSDPSRWTHTFEVLWLHADRSTFDKAVAGFRSDGSKVDVDESGGAGAGHGAVTYATIAPGAGWKGELTLREPTDVLPDEFVTLTWTRT